MKKTSLTIFIISAILLSLLAGVQVSQVVAQNNGTNYISFRLTITSPSNTTTYKLTMPLNFTVDWTIGNAPIAPLGKDYSYSIDDKPLVSVSSQNALVDISNLTNAYHKLVISVEMEYNWNNDFIELFNSSSTPIYFLVYNFPPPSIYILSPQNRSYNTINIPLNFVVGKPASWIGYSLDSQTSLTVTGNTTLTGLIDGSYSLVTFANDTIGNIGKSDTVFFTINTQPSPIPSISPSPLPTQRPTLEPTQSAKPTLEPKDSINLLPLILGIVALVTVVAVIALSILVYLRRVKK